jgi:ATP synthase protein I
MQTLPPTARLIGIGFYIALCIVIGTIGGRELDKAVDTGSLFTIIGLALGLALALYGGIQQLMEVLAEINRRRTGEGKRSD